MSDDQALCFLDEMNLATALAPGEWFQIGIAESRSNTLIGDIGVRVSGNGLEAEIGLCGWRRRVRLRSVVVDNKMLVALNSDSAAPH